MAPQENVVSAAKIVEAVKAFRQLRNVELSKKDKSSILDSDDRNERFVHLQLTVKKMSAAQKITMVPFVFPHCLVQEDDEVCFIVGCKDGDKGNKRADHERYANEYKQKLRKLGIEREIHILPIMQLETEFKSFEAKRKLCQAFDHFICDHRILFRMPQLLGHSFFRRRKLPIRVYMKNENELKANVENAIQKTLIYVTPEGPNVSIKIGNLLDHTDEQIADNIRAVLGDFVEDNLPGGRSNLNSIHLASFAGRSVPLFVSLASANSVDMTDVDRKFIEKQTPTEIEDTIDTMPGVRVKVRSDGKVVALKDDSEPLDTDELLDSDYLDVFRDQEFEERDEAKKRHVKHMARKATLRKVGKRFGSNMLKLPSHVPLPKSAGNSTVARQQKLPKQKSKIAGAAPRVALDALQGYVDEDVSHIEDNDDHDHDHEDDHDRNRKRNRKHDDENRNDDDDDECPQLIPIANEPTAKRQTKSLGHLSEASATLTESKAKKSHVQRKSTTGFVQDVMAETPAKKLAKKKKKNRNSEFVVEVSPKQQQQQQQQKTPPKSANKHGMTVTKIETPAGDKHAKLRLADTPRPILKTPLKTPAKEKRKSVTFDFTPDSDANPRTPTGVSPTTKTPAPSSAGGVAKKRKISTGLFDVTPMSVKKQKNALKQKLAATASDESFDVDASPLAGKKPAKLVKRKSKQLNKA